MQSFHSHSTLKKTKQSLVTKIKKHNYQPWWMAGLNYDTIYIPLVLIRNHDKRFYQTPWICPKENINLILVCGSNIQQNGNSLASKQLNQTLLSARGSSSTFMFFDIFKQVGRGSLFVFIGKASSNHKTILVLGKMDWGYPIS